MGVQIGYGFEETPQFGPIPYKVPVDEYRPGGLGNLGGMPTQQTPFFQSPEFGNIIQSLGMSLMGSGRNEPLAGFAPLFMAGQRGIMEQREKQTAQREQQQTKNMTRQWLISQGIPEQEADAAIANPGILNAIIKRMQGGERQGLMNTGEGIYDPNTGQWIMPPNSGKDDYSQREAAALQHGLQPGTKEFQNFVLTGKISMEEDRGLSATESKEVWASEDEIPLLDNTIESLDLAKQLNDKTFTGVTAGARGWLGTAVPGGDMLVDGNAAAATSEFGKLMSMEAIQAMAQTLKGATTDRELARFVEILADPSTPPDIRGRTIDRMKNLAQRMKQIKQARIQELRGGTPASSAPAGSGYKILSVE